MYASDVTTCRKVCGRYFVFNRNDVVKRLRCDLLEEGWLRLGKSLFKPLDVGFSESSRRSPGGCVTISYFLEWESACAFIGSKLAANIGMRWLDGVSLCTCVMVIGGLFNLCFFSWRAEQWFQKLLMVYNSNFDMKR